MRFLFISLFFLSYPVWSSSFFQIKDKTITGETFEASSLKGKAVLIVNIASQCGYTDQLSKLEKLHQKYKAKGLVVLGVPSNDFGGQTPENDKEMMQFCQKNYQVSFPLLSKGKVHGKEKRELYRFLTEKGKKKFQGEVSWNFEKFLIDQNGEVVGRMRSSLDPLSKEMTQAIDSVIKMSK